MFTMIVTARIRKILAMAEFILEKKFEAPVKIGVSIAGIQVENRIDGFIYPDLALEWKYFSLGTTGLRLGSRSEFYFEGKIFDRPPFFPGRGLFHAGFGGKLKNSDINLWGGVGVFPYNDLGITGQIEIPYSDNLFLYFNGRYGIERKSGMDEFGLSIGARLVEF